VVTYPSWFSTWQVGQRIPDAAARGRAGRDAAHWTRPRPEAGEHNLAAAKRVQGDGPDVAVGVVFAAGDLAFPSAAQVAARYQARRIALSRGAWVHDACPVAH
jgi:hypothetical protein